CTASVAEQPRPQHPSSAAIQNHKWNMDHGPCSMVHLVNAMPYFPPDCRHRSRQFITFVVSCSTQTGEHLMSRFSRTIAFAALTGLCVSVAMYAQQSGVANKASNVALNVTNEVLRRTATANDPLPGAWLSYGRTQGETRYSTLKQIDTTNAKRLGLVWSYAMGAGGGNQEGTPLMWNNTLYGITTRAVEFALDHTT